MKGYDLILPLYYGVCCYGGIKQAIPAISIISIFCAAYTLYLIYGPCFQKGGKTDKRTFKSFEGSDLFQDQKVYRIPMSNL